MVVPESSSTSVALIVKSTDSQSYVFNKYVTTTDKKMVKINEQVVSIL